jgi:predicted Zn-dependent peptidase
MTELRRLKSGLQLYADVMPGVESAALGFWVRTGAIDETPGESGVAHLLEHMAFKGTARRTARAIAEEIESVGGYLNAVTSYQRTGYYARILKADIPVAVDVLADILSRPLFDEGELAKEREVVVQEIGEANDQPDDHVHDLLQSLKYRGQSAGRPILGSIDTVRSHDSAALRDFMRRHYRPEAMVFAAAGAVDPDALAAMIDNAFEPQPAAPGCARAMPTYIGGAAHELRDVDQTHIALAFPGVGVLDRDYFATRVLAELYGGGMSSRLFQRIREERGLAYSVYAYTESFDEAGSVGVSMGTDESSAQEAVSIVRAELTDIADGIGDGEIARARAVLKATLVMGLESPQGRMEASVGQIFAYGRALGAAEICARLDAVGADDIRRCARRAIEAGKPTLAVVGPARFSALAAAAGC